MKLLSKSLIFILLFCSLLSKAQQIAGGEISYSCNGNDRYTVSLVLYAKCPNPSFPPTVNLSIFSSSTNTNVPAVAMTPSGSDEIIRACAGKQTACEGGTGESASALSKRTYTASIALPRKLKDWLLVVQEGPRTSMTNVKGQNLMNLTALINNSGTICNTSPKFNNNPISFSSSELPVTYDPGITNPDNDKLLVEIVTPKTSVQQNLEYVNSSFNPRQPFSTSGTIKIDPNNGKLTFTPSKAGESSSMAIQVKETRNGEEVGRITREMYFQTMPKLSSPPFFTGPDTVKICQGNPVSFTYEGGSADPSVHLDIILNNKAKDWPNASVNVTRSAGKVIFSLNAASLPVNSVRPLNLSVVDDKCGILTKEVIVKVYPKPSITNRVSDTTVLCLKPFTLKVNATGGVRPYTYSWSNSTENSQNFTVNAAGVYTATVTDKNGCFATWTKRVISPINFTKSSVSCVDSLFAFYDISLGMRNPLRSNPQPGTVAWKWNFGDNSPVDNSETPKHKFPDSDVLKTYSVTMEVSDGKDCNNSITKNVRVFPKPKVPFVFSDTCQQTERSDLEVTDLFSSDTTIHPANIQYYVDGIFRTTASGNRFPTKLRESVTGQHEVSVTVKDDAGCVNTLTATSFVYPKPKIVISPLRSTFFYRCDSPGFPDTVFTYKGVADSKSLPLFIRVTRAGYEDSLLPNSSDVLVTMPYTIKQNEDNFLNFMTNDKLGCTNDTMTTIFDPINPEIRLKKYYCFDGDTLKLIDSTFLARKSEDTTRFLPRNYTWGLSSSTWNMQDGKTETTHGYSNHKYTLKSLDEALVTLAVKDKTGCTDTTAFKVYLSEPDTSQFSVMRPMSCVAEDVKISAIKNKYINSWYFRYRDTTSDLQNNFDKQVFNDTFGSGVPANLDETQRAASNSYVASTLIFYNEADHLKNFDLDPRFFPFARVTKLPRTIAQPEVCHIQVTRKWKVIERLKYNILDEYNHCYGFDKSFTAYNADTAIKSVHLVDNSWQWKLSSPSGGVLETVNQVSDTTFKYTADSSFFSEVVSSRAVPSTQLYTVKIKYSYTNDTIVCADSATLNIDNEKVSFIMDPNFQTCSFYSNFFQFTTPQFLDGAERQNTIWTYSDSTKSDTANQVLHQFLKPGSYTVIANATNKYGCKGSDSTVVKVKPSPKAELTTGPTCFGNESLLDGKSNASDSTSEVASYYWYYSPAIPLTTDPNVPDTTKAIKITHTGTDSILDKFPVGNNPVGLAIKDANGCFSIAPITFAKVNPVPVSDFKALAKSTMDTDYLGNEPVDFIPQTQQGTYREWRFGNGDKNISGPNDTTDVTVTYTYPYFAPPFPKEKNMYDVTLLVRTKEGCVDSVTKKLDVNVYFELPNAFSPNEDGLHDNLLGVGKGIKEIKEFKIFNRWGEVIHSVSGLPEKDALKRGYLLWDGMYNGQTQPVGVYVYYAVVKTGYGNDLVKKGNLTLLR